MNKNAIQKYAIWARNELIEQVKQRAYQYGISAKGYGDENATVIAGHVLSADEKRQRAAFVREIKRHGFEQAVEDVAYTWFNRFIALRFMEVNDYLPTHVRVFSDASGGFNPEILKDVLHLELEGLDKSKVSEMLNANQTEELYRYLLLTQCNALNAALPEMFEKLGTYTEMLLPNNILKQESVLAHLVKDIDEADWKDAVQIIGWMYQYYISEKHDQIINIYKGTIKKEDIPAATQLFTTDWVVRYMVDNSLGRYWIERNPESKLANSLDFFATPKDGKINYINEKVAPQDLTFFDPCMGSGHILVYAFDVLIKIYLECGYSERDAAISIVENNLFGLDIDTRAYQLAYFAIMMKARSYNRRVLSSNISCNLCAVDESNDIKHFTYNGLTNDKEQNKIGEYLVDAFRHAREIGSIQTINNHDYKAFDSYLDTIGKGTNEQIDILSSLWINDVLPLMRRFAKQAGILSKKYAVVCTNPPYMNKLEGHLKDFVVTNYKAYSGDLFSVFMYRNFGFCKKDGYSAFMTPFVWMFIKTYEALRSYIIDTKSITSLVQMEYSAFEEATVPICSFVLKNSKESSNGLYFKLSEFKGGMEVQKEKVIEAIANKNCGYFYETDQSNFTKIPSSPIAYWVSEKFIDAFVNGKPLGDLAISRNGMKTGENEKFIRQWFEIENNKFKNNSKTYSEAIESKAKWFPYNKGGEYRKWYGNNDYVVNWENEGQEVIKNAKLDKRNVQDYPENLKFSPSASWGLISSGQPSFRYKEYNISDIAGMSFYADRSLVLYLLAFCNSPISKNILEILAPTINYQSGDIGRLPILISDKKDDVINLSEQNISISKTDWDAFETSWDFTKHPLLNGERTVASAFAKWECEAAERFNTLKANEEELNRIFIDIYGLQDELTPDVEERDVTVRRADLGREIRSLISHAVGCMFGRYSLDTEGLAYAGGDWDAGRYRSFIPDKDNILPICDDEYFDDDILGRFVDFVRVVFGAETLEENLKFIADALGGKGTPREVIRNYFLNDFYTDHCKIYQKRPIYWLFDSGKKNGFKSLIYLHRYQSDLLAKLRTDYVHEQQERYRTQLSHIAAALNTATGSERARLLKQQDKLSEQLKEITAFEEKVHHLADQNIEIDLDEGVKKNYEIFTDVLAKI